MAKALKDILKQAHDRIKGTHAAQTSAGSLGKDPGVDYDPKAGDEQEFVAKHSVEKWDEPSGNPNYSDGVKHALTTAQNKLMGNTEDEAKKAYFTAVKESVAKKAEDIKCNRTPAKTWCPVHEMADCTMSKTIKEEETSAEFAKRVVSSAAAQADKDRKETKKYIAKQDAYRKKLASDVAAAKSKKTNEEVEQVDELSSALLKRAMNKAGNQAMWLRSAGKNNPGYQKKYAQAKKFQQAGIAKEKQEKAMKEEADQIEEGQYSGTPSKEYGTVTFRGTISQTNKKLKDYTARGYKLHKHTQDNGKHNYTMKHPDVKEEVVDEASRLDIMKTTAKKSAAKAGVTTTPTKKDFASLPKKRQDAINNLLRRGHTTSDAYHKTKHMGEEVEQLDELDRDQGSILNRYIRKTTDDPKRKAGRDLALQKKWGDKNYGTPEPKVKAVAREEVEVSEEQIDELSRNTLHKYVQKSHSQTLGVAANGFGTKKSGIPSYYKGKNKDLGKDPVQKFKKRAEGQKLAIKKLNKEEVEQVDEVLTKKSSAGEWIHDFVHSDNPKFAGKSKKERMKQALAAYYAKKKSVKEDLAMPLLGGDPPRGNSEEAVDMVKTELKALATKAMHLVENMPANMHVEPWVQAKIAQAKSMVSDVHDYCIYGNHEEDEQTGPETPMTFPNMSVDVNTGQNV